MPEYGKITYVVADGVATITLDDPETRNALSAELLGELIAALEGARDDDEVRVVVLTSSHEKVFSAGGNLAGFGSDATTSEKLFGTDDFVAVFRIEQRRDENGRPYQQGRAQAVAEAL